MKFNNGYFWFEGRSDDIIISSGYTIGPFEVEDALIKHPLVKECAVVASPDEIRGAIVKAFVILKDSAIGNDNLVEELQEYVKTSRLRINIREKSNLSQNFLKLLRGRFAVLN